jgi:hypothetical protein
MTAGDFLVAAVKAGVEKKTSVIKSMDEDAKEIPNINSTKTIDKMADLEQRAIEHAKTLNGRRMN